MEVFDDDHVGICRNEPQGRCAGPVEESPNCDGRRNPDRKRKGYCCNFKRRPFHLLHFSLGERLVVGGWQLGMGCIGLIDLYGQ